MKPRLCFVGPMVGRNAGYVTTQGEILADHFERSGFPVISVSSARNRYLRLLEIVATLVQHRSRVDLIMLQTFGGPSFVVEDIASLIGRLTGKRIIMHLRGGAMPEFMDRFPVWTRRVLCRADALVTPSEFLRRLMNVHGREASVIPNLIDLTKYHYRLRRSVAPRLLWMRSFHPIYNPTMAVRVLARLRRAFPDATLVMGGQDKGQESDTRQLAATLGVSDAVRFVGFMDTECKRNEGDAAEIFINTNRVDNMPVSLVEAAAMGLPIVSTAVGGIGDLLVDEHTGLLVPDNDDEAMAGAIMRLVSTPELAERLSTNGRSLAEQCSWDRVLPVWEGLISKVMSGNSREE